VASICNRRPLTPASPALDERLSPRLRLRIGEQEWEVGPGDAWCIPLNVEHGAQVLEDSIAVEVFSPVREDYLPKSDD